MVALQEHLLQDECARQSAQNVRTCRKSGSSEAPVGATEYDSTMFTSTAIGIARTPFTESRAIPKGPGAKHDAIGTLEILEAFEVGLTDVEGFSHLYVL